jgi:hypothetical protein
MQQIHYWYISDAIKKCGLADSEMTRCDAFIKHVCRDSRIETLNEKFRFITASMDKLQTLSLSKNCDQRDSLVVLLPDLPVIMTNSVLKSYDKCILTYETPLVVEHKKLIERIEFKLKSWNLTLYDLINRKLKAEIPNTVRDILIAEYNTSVDEHFHSSIIRLFHETGYSEDEKKKFLPWLIKEMSAPVNHRIAIEIGQAIENLSHPEYGIEIAQLLEYTPLGIGRVFLPHALKKSKNPKSFQILKRVALENSKVAAFAVKSLGTLRLQGAEFLERERLLQDLKESPSQDVKIESKRVLDKLLRRK